MKKNGVRERECVCVCEGVFCRVDEEKRVDFFLCVCVLLKESRGSRVSEGYNDWDRGRIQKWHKLSIKY